MLDSRLNAFALGAVLALASTGAAFAQEPADERCELGRIDFIFVATQSVFDTSDLEEGDRLLWLYDFANALHWRTREEFIRSELLFEEGDCIDPALLVESERLLRNHAFIASASVFPVQQLDGSIHVSVLTTDEWTLQFSLRAKFEEGFEFNGFDLQEENMLGRGISTRFFLRQNREDREVGFSVSTVRVAGTRADAAFQASRTRVGNTAFQSLTYPFVGEFGRFAGKQTLWMREDLFAYTLEEDPEFTHVVVPYRTENVEVTLARRSGRPGNLTIYGGGISYDELDFDAVEGGVEVVRDRNFAERFDAPEEYEDPVLMQNRGRAVTRFNVLLGKRFLRFEPRAGLDALQGVQDVAEGLELSGALGLSIGALTPGNADEKVRDTFGRFRIFAGWAPGDVVLASTFAVEGRRVRQAIDGTPDGWRDVLGEADVYAYWRPGDIGHTLFARVSAAGGWNVDLPFQLTAGGASGVRGFSLDRLPGGRRVVASLEDRIYLGSPGGRALDMGMTVFTDVGRTWAGDVPFGVDSGWVASVGAGLRIGFPSGTRGVLRIDVATPITGNEAFQGVTFRVTSSELLGLRRGFTDTQIRRSQQSRVGAGILPNPAQGR